MSDLIPLTKVYIIESPSFMDTLDNRKEGLALSKILDLSTIKNKILTVSNLETLELALARIAENVSEIKKDIGMIHLHFSLHGSEEGIALADRTFIDWKFFHKIIKGFNDNIGYIKGPDGGLYAPTQLVFSVCNGYAARKIQEIGDTSMYTGLVGPTEAIEWADGLLAYSTFYHNTIIKKFGAPKAVENMNLILGLDNVFQVDVGKGLKIAK